MPKKETRTLLTNAFENRKKYKKMLHFNLELYIVFSLLYTIEIVHSFRQIEYIHELAHLP